MTPNFSNVARHLRVHAEKNPQKLASIKENGESINFLQMEQTCEHAVAEFKKMGIRSGDRVATFIRPGLDFVPVIFALFRIGAIPVFIDPGMSLSNMLKCIESSKCTAMLGVALAHLLKKFRPKSFRHIKICICMSRFKWLAKILSANHLAKFQPSKILQGDAEIATVTKNQTAAILFTSGSTGIPKGVEVTFGILEKQQELLRETFAISDNEIDLVPFPLFALFSAAWGITSVIPAMNPARPARCSGKKLFQLMTKHQVTHTSGSPAIWKNVLSYCQDNRQSFKHLKRVLMAGAPVSEKLILGWRQILAPSANVFTPYGATEALPLTVISDKELIAECYLQTRAGHGTCVGHPIKNTKIKIIKISNHSIGQISEIQELAVGEIGEVIVQSEVVTQKYFDKPDANKLAKILDVESQQIWHRMGDLGYLDTTGRLWFCGRKDHLIKTEQKTELYPDQLEAIFNQLNGVTRTALVGVPRKGILEVFTPVLMVEMKPKLHIKKMLLQKAIESEQTRLIKDILFVKSFPTDVRHNIKINRGELAKTAQRQMGER